MWFKHVLSGDWPIPVMWHTCLFEQPISMAPFDTKWQFESLQLLFALGCRKAEAKPQPFNNSQHCLFFSHQWLVFGAKGALDVLEQAAFPLNIENVIDPLLSLEQPSPRHKEDANHQLLTLPILGAHYLQRNTSSSEMVSSPLPTQGIKYARLPECELLYGKHGSNVAIPRWMTAAI